MNAKRKRPNSQRPLFIISNAKYSIFLTSPREPKQECANKHVLLCLATIRIECSAKY